MSDIAKLIKYNNKYWQPVTLVDSEGVEINLAKDTAQDVSIVDENGSYIDITDLSVKITDGTNTAAVNSSGQLKVVLDGAICEDNSTNTPLTNNAIFLGEWNDTLDYAIIQIVVITDVLSAPPSAIVIAYKKPPSTSEYPAGQSSQPFNKEGIPCS